MTNVSIFDLVSGVNDASVSGTDGSSPSGDAQTGSHVVGGAVGACSAVMFLIIVGLIIKKNLEAVAQICASIAQICTTVQGTFNDITTTIRSIGNRGDAPPPLPPRTHPRNLTDEEILYMRAEQTSRPEAFPTNHYDYV